MRESLDRYADQRLRGDPRPDPRVDAVPAPHHLPGIEIEPAMDGVHVFAPDSKAQGNPMWAAVGWLTLVLLGGATGFGMVVWPDATDWVVGGAFATGVVVLAAVFAAAYFTGIPEGLRIRGDRAFIVSGSGKWECDVASLQVHAWTFDVVEGEKMPARTFGYIRVHGPVDGSDLFRGYFDQRQAEQLAEYLQWCVSAALQRDRGHEDEVPDELGRLVDRD